MKDPRRIEKVHELKRLADALQAHAQDIANDEYGCPDICLRKAYDALAVLVQDYVI